MMKTLEVKPYPRSIRKSAQRLRWFFRSFEDEVAALSSGTGIIFSIDQTRLAAVFVDWLAAFNAQKPDELEQRPAYVGFAAGLMLRALITKNPLRVIGARASADAKDPVHVWPEGYLYVAYCLKVRGMVIEQDFQGRQQVSARLGDLRIWQSFKENVETDPASALAFLDLFADEEPDWATPDLFRPAWLGGHPDHASRNLLPHRLA